MAGVNCQRCGVEVLLVYEQGYPRVIDIDHGRYPHSQLWVQDTTLARDNLGRVVWEATRMTRHRCGRHVGKGLSGTLPNFSAESVSP